MSDSANKPTKEEFMARIAELEKKLETTKTGRLEFKVSEKGGVSIYALGRRLKVHCEKREAKSRGIP